MLTTTHYGLNIVEGTDVVNPLVQQNPNYTEIDSAMFANKQAVIGTGTELTAGSVHTITRANPDSNYVRFTATSNWTAGDSMVIDSTPCTVYLSDGTAPKTGAYVINTEVLILVNGSRVTLLASSNSFSATDVSYDDSVTGLGNDVQEAIDNVNSFIKRAAVSPSYNPDITVDSQSTFFHIGMLYYGNIIFTANSNIAAFDTLFNISGANNASSCTAVLLDRTDLSATPKIVYKTKDSDGFQTISALTAGHQYRATFVC